MLDALDDYPSEKLASMWDVKSLYMQRIIDANGGNAYATHRPPEERQAAKRQKL